MLQREKLFYRDKIFFLVAVKMGCLCTRQNLDFELEKVEEEITTATHGKNECVESKNSLLKKMEKFSKTEMKQFHLENRLEFNELDRKIKKFTKKINELNKEKKEIDGLIQQDEVLESTKRRADRGKQRIHSTTIGKRLFRYGKDKEQIQRGSMQTQNVDDEMRKTEEMFSLHDEDFEENEGLLGEYDVEFSQFCRENFKVEDTGADIMQNEMKPEKDKRQILYN